MITRVVSLVEKNGAPTLTNFPGAHHVSNQVDGHFTVYLPARGKRHLHSLMLWRQSAGVYAVFGEPQVVKALDLEAKNLVAYCNQTTHSWRVFSCDGTDSAIDPETGKAIGPFTGKTLTFSSQPPKNVNTSKPYVLGSMSITAIKPTILSDSGKTSLIDCIDKELDSENIKE